MSPLRARCAHLCLGALCIAMLLFRLRSTSMLRARVGAFSAASQIHPEPCWPSVKVTADQRRDRREPRYAQQ